MAFPKRVVQQGGLIPLDAGAGGVDIGTDYEQILDADNAVVGKVNTYGQRADNRTTVAAAGDAQGNATLLTGGLVTVTAADGTKGVILPTAFKGLQVVVKNNASSTLKVYPASGAAIDAASANAAFSVPALGVCIFRADSTTQWWSGLFQTGAVSPTGALISSRETIAAAGTVQGDATAATAGLVTVTAADGAKGIILPATPVAGQQMVVKNNAAAILLVYPGSGDAINALGANAPLSVPALGVALLFADSTSQWWAEVVPDGFMDANGAFVATRTTVAAAGSAQGDAAAIVSGHVTVTAADGTKGVVLPATPAVGAVIFVKNNANAVLKVYPGSGDAINALGANTAMSVPPLATAVFRADTTGLWWGVLIPQFALGATANGLRVAAGVAAITGSGDVVTGLTTVTAVAVSPQSDMDGVTLAAVSATVGNQAGAPAAGSVTIKAWKITAVGDATLIAADAAKNVNWIAYGT